MIELNHQDVVNFSKSVFSFNENISKDIYVMLSNVRNSVPCWTPLFHTNWFNYSFLLLMKIALFGKKSIYGVFWTLELLLDNDWNANFIVRLLEVRKKKHTFVGI